MRCGRLKIFSVDEGEGGFLVTLVVLLITTVVNALTCVIIGGLGRGGRQGDLSGVTNSCTSNVRGNAASTARIASPSVGIGGIRGPVSFGSLRRRGDSVCS